MALLPVKISILMKTYLLTFCLFAGLMATALAQTTPSSFPVGRTILIRGGPIRFMPNRTYMGSNTQIGTYTLNKQQITLTTIPAFYD